jgi:hypothetical protein
VSQNRRSAAGVSGRRLRCHALDLYPWCRRTTLASPVLASRRSKPVVSRQAPAALAHPCAADASRPDVDPAFHQHAGKAENAPALVANSTPDSQGGALVEIVPIERGITKARLMTYTGLIGMAERRRIASRILAITVAVTIDRHIDAISCMRNTRLTVTIALHRANK